MKRITTVAVLLFLFIFLSSNSFAKTIKASASGSTEVTPECYAPPPLENPPPPPTLQNGAFTIIHTDKYQDSWRCVGDSLNEYTEWTFDFTSKFSDDLLLQSLQSAILTLNIIFVVGIDSDSVYPEALEAKSIKEIRRDLPVPPWPDRYSATVKFDMLDYWTPEEILEVLDDGDGEIEMIYKDDALVYRARLALKFKKIKEE